MNIQLTRFAKPILIDTVQDYLKYTKPLTNFNAEIWKQKTDNGISKKEALQREIPEELEPFKSELTEMHHLI